MKFMKLDEEVEEEKTNFPIMESKKIKEYSIKKQ